MGSVSKTLKSKDLPVESHMFDKLSLEQVATVLEDGLKSNFEEASVTVVECEDLTKSPWKLAAPGISGSPKLLDIGGVPYLTPHVHDWTEQRSCDRSRSCSLALPQQECRDDAKPVCGRRQINISPEY